MEVEEDTWARLELDNVHHAATEQIDWSSFVNLEYDPTRPIAPTAGQLATAEPVPQKISNDLQVSSGDHSAPNTEDVSAFATLDFPTLEEWWAELPNEIQSGDWVSPADTAVFSGNTPHSDSNSSSYAEEYLLKEGEGRTEKKTRRMPPEARRLLTNCFERHREDPYIPKGEVQRLATDTGLSIRQVQIFFANARARKLPGPSTQSKGVDIPAPPDQQGPMERFLSSSPEDEGISEDAVRTAANVMNRPIKPARSRKGRTPSTAAALAKGAKDSASPLIT
ncbi:uncharacterized protein N0V89_010442 [Didymosphaeria variabile]|uniref:Homeobox domain-containing protein n=1 Tax=Didymosphaeria variabile TaxID=1932322 RepID=A0A9W8XBS9_9PLEO|nr:uncharacterized protein N0V89_010442 [Didymosphaeria variabile]KAJ4346513.1 hypothetical protein N0V89_010442 [Didymosphaeria variabile]